MRGHAINRRDTLGSAFLSRFFNSTPDQCYILADEGRIEAVNEVAVNDLKTTRSALIAKQFHPMITEESRDSLSGILTCLKEGRVVRGMELSIRVDAQIVTLSFSATKLDPQAARSERCLLVGRDVSLLADMVRQSEYKALHDQLTGAYNRWCLAEILKRERARALRHTHSVSFIMLDIDGFKFVNDQHGHSVGDAALRWISKQLQSALRECDSVVRFGGDEFLMVLPETDGEVTTVGQRILEVVAEAGAEATELFLPMNVSIGTSTWHPNDHRDISDAMKEADCAMYASRTNR